MLKRSHPFEKKRKRHSPQEKRGDFLVEKKKKFPRSMIEGMGRRQEGKATGGIARRPFQEIRSFCLGESSVPSGEREKSRLYSVANKSQKLHIKEGATQKRPALLREKKENQKPARRGLKGLPNGASEKGPRSES